MDIFYYNIFKLDNVSIMLPTINIIIIFCTSKFVQCHRGPTLIIVAF